MELLKSQLASLVRQYGLDAVLAALPKQPKTENGLERVFSKGHPHYDRFFYDVKEGLYYDQSTDLYLDFNELSAYGITP